ncbi:MAG: DeoR/GlpR family DNA-binding transcription regulator [Eubacteriales bacterium]|nr:DeoR/GlpR family DNA-binding transcription regulator [Eubacteriales bacterium]
MGKVTKQQQLIYERLKGEGQISLREAIDFLNVSESTVRRLFINLEKSGKVIRTYGGIQFIPEPQSEYSFDALQKQNVDLKEKITEFAISLVDNGDTIYLDSGTTLSMFSKALSDRIESGNIKEITIFTNSLINMNVLHKSSSLLLIGGEFRENRKDFCGYIAEETLRNLHFTKCFLGSDGFNNALGFTTTDFRTARLNEIVLQNSLKSYILMDSSKFNTSAMVSYSRKSPPPAALITNMEPPQTSVDKLISQGTRIILSE